MIKNTLFTLIFSLLCAQNLVGKVYAVGIADGSCSLVRGTGLHAMGGDSEIQDYAWLYTSYTGGQPACYAAITAACNAYAAKAWATYVKKDLGFEEAFQHFFSSYIQQTPVYRGSVASESLREIFRNLYDNPIGGKVMRYSCREGDMPTTDEPVLDEIFRRAPEDQPELNWEFRPPKQSPYIAPEFEWDFTDLIDDFLYFLDLLYENGGFLVLTTLSGILIGFLGVKMVETIFTGGLALANPLTVLACLGAIILLIDQAELTQYDTEHRLQKYESLTSVIDDTGSIDLAGGQISFDLQPLIDLSQALPKVPRKQMGIDFPIAIDFTIDPDCPSNCALTIRQTFTNEKVDNVSIRGTNVQYLQSALKRAANSYRPQSTQQNQLGRPRGSD